VIPSSDWSRRVSTPSLTALPNRSSGGRQHCVCRTGRLHGLCHAVEGEMIGSSLDPPRWSRCILCHPRVLVRPSFDEYRVHFERNEGETR
jgi:hypothetical protein